MKVLICGLVLGFAADLAARSAWADGQAVKSAPQVVRVIAKADGQATDSDGATNAIAVVREVEDADATNRGWLGVILLETPDPLAAQLDIKDNGVLIGNVAKGSPADAAGFQAHDIVLAINGKTVGREVRGAIDIIRASKPGETLTFTILRNGQQQALTATLGKRPANQNEVEWKFEGPEGKLEERIRTRGGILMRDPSGAWTMRDLGELDALHGLPKVMTQLIPDTSSKQVQVTVQDGKRVVSVKVEKDGTTLSVNQNDQGITVSRTDANGQTSSATYENEEALAAADPEAAELLKSVGHNVIIDLDDEEGEFFDVDVDFAEIKENLEEARKAYEQAMEEFHKTMSQWRSDLGLNDEQFGKLHELFEQHKEKLPKAFDFSLGKPRQTFEVRPDGSIEVRTRKGDSELVEVYRDEADLANRNPRASAKYQSLKSDRE